jgi:predicted enzyme related to lactoylglutathione lyase
MDEPSRTRSTFLGRRVPLAFRVRVVTVAPGEERAFDPAEWRDALVAVEQGELELECMSGGRRRFGRGSILWLCGLRLRALRSTGRESVLLVALSRERADEFVPAGVSVRLVTPSPKEAQAMTGTFVWFDLHTKTPDAGDFYARLLGWGMEPKGDQHVMMSGENGPFAMLVAEGEGDAAWVPYVQVDDLHAAHTKAVELGATVLREPTQGPEGDYSWIRDTGGAPVALWQRRS